MGFIRGDSKGQLFSLDLLFALIPLTIVLGMVAADMDNVMYLVQDTVYRGSTERVAADTVDALLKTSGTPYNWESNGTLQVIGLAKSDPITNKSIPDVISPGKLASINESYINGSGNSLMGPEYGFNITITFLEGPRKGQSIYPPVGSPPSGTDIVKIERVVLYGGLDVVAQLKDVIRYNAQPRDYMSTEFFPTDTAYLNAYDYYVLVDNHDVTSARINFNNNQKDAVSPDDFNKHVNPIVVKIDPTMLMNQTNLQYNHWEVDQVASKPGSWMDVYIIQADKGTDPNDINLNNAVPHGCLFQFYAWTK